MIALCRLALAWAFIVFVSFPLFSQTFPEVLSVREIVLKSDASEMDYQKGVTEAAAAMKKHGQGVSVQLWKGDRGERTNGLMFTWTFQTKENREFYFPSADATEYPNLMALMEKGQITLDPNDPQVESGMDTYTDYVVVGYDQIKKPKMGKLMAIRPFEVKPGSEEAFEKVVMEVMNPLSQKAVKGVYRYVLKGDRGERTGKYLLVDCYESAQLRDEYFPTVGGDASESYSKQVEDLPDLAEKIGPMMQSPPSSYTDYVIMK